jgi:kinesin family protein 18/19
VGSRRKLMEDLYRTKCDDGPLFLGDGSLAGIPTPKLHQKGIRPVIKVVDDKCL